MTTRSPVYLDCDTGIDDSLALAQLVSRVDVELVGVSTVSGNIDAARAARNTLDLLALLGRDDVPVAVGEHRPLTREYAGGAPGVHGRNGIGGVELPRATRPVSALDGPEQLIAAARAHPGRLHLIAVGPLTNLARALERAPGLPGLIGRLTVMGGAVWHPGNITPRAEANIHNDAEAARIVLTTDWPITLVPLDVTTSHRMDAAAQGELAARGTVLHTALAGMLDYYLGFHETRHGERSCVLHDPLATMLATGQATATTVRRTGLDVGTTGEDRGRTVAVEPGPGHPAVDVVTEVAEPAGPQLLQSLLGLPEA